MARCVMLIFHRLDNDSLIKAEILQQLGYAPIEIIPLVKTDDQVYIDIQSYVYGFLNTENQLITLDSLQWSFPLVSHTKIKRLFSQLVSQEYQRAHKVGLSASLVICGT